MGAQMRVAVGQIDRLADQQRVGTIDPRLADARVEHGGLKAGVGADHQNGTGAVDIGDGGVTDIAAAITGGQRCTVLPALGTIRAEACQQRF